MSGLALDERAVLRAYGPKISAVKVAEVEAVGWGGASLALRELRNDVLAVGGEVLLLTVGHEVDVELVDADRLELHQLLGRLLGGAEDAEAIADLVGHELAVLRA